jgi:hypothetical protein
VTGPTGFTGLGQTGPTGSGGGGGGIITYYENSGSAVTPSLNTSIRVIAGGYYTNLSLFVALTMPTATASNDYINIEYVISTSANTNGFAGPLVVNFPAYNSFSQDPSTQVNYFWDGYTTTWSLTSWRAGTTTHGYQ